jgi:hypothetical protein
LDASISRPSWTPTPKWAFAKWYTTKAPIAAADVFNDRVLPFYQEHQMPLLRVLTDRDTEYCGKVEQHDYQLYLAVTGELYWGVRPKVPHTRSPNYNERSSAPHRSASTLVKLIFSH